MNTRGFTLIELMVVAVLTVVVAGGLLTAFLTGQTSYFSADAYIQVQQEARRAFDVMVRELREAGPSEGAGTLLHTDPAGAPAAGTSNRLNFQVAMGFNVGGSCPATGICWGDGTNQTGWVHYFVRTNTALSQGNQLQLMRCESGGPSTAVGSMTNCRVLANNVFTASFNLDSTTTPKVVTINLQVRYQSALVPGGFQGIGVGTGVSPLIARVRLRNAP